LSADGVRIALPAGVRHATAADAPVLAALAAELGYPTSPAAAEARLAELAGERSAALVTVDRGGAVVGLLTLAVVRYVHRPPDARITSLIVTREVRGQGHGTRLLRAADRLAHAWRCARLEVTSGFRLPEAHAFYRARGFVESAHRFTHSLEDARDARDL
jgi:GNAT superfamily N-acetyltransferase